MNAQLKESATPQRLPRYYIGGGNVAGILGVSPYKSPLDEWLTITGQGPAETPEQLAFFRRRKALEPFACEVFEGHTGLKIERTNHRYVDSQHEFLRAELDFETSDGGNGETKTVHPLAARDWGDPGTDQIPVYVTAQAMHGLGITGRSPTWVHAIIGLDDDRIYRIDRDDETIAAMREASVRFWHENVVARVAPEPITRDDLLRMFAKDRGSALEADAAVLADLNRLRELAKSLKSDEAEHDALKLRVQLAMRDHSRVTFEGKDLCTWKAQTSQRFDQAAFSVAYPELAAQFKRPSETRVFRIK